MYRQRQRAPVSAYTRYTQQPFGTSFVSCQHECVRANACTSTHVTCFTQSLAVRDFHFATSSHIFFFCLSSSQRGIQYTYTRNPTRKLYPQWFATCRKTVLPQYDLNCKTLSFGVAFWRATIITWGRERRFYIHIARYVLSVGQSTLYRLNTNEWYTQIYVYAITSRRGKKIPRQDKSSIIPTLRDDRSPPRASSFSETTTNSSTCRRQLPARIAAAVIAPDGYTDNIN